MIRIDNQSIKQVIYTILPVIVMIGLIPLVKNDYFLTLIFVLFIALLIKRQRASKELITFLLGFIVMFLSECFFISTGVEEFNRNSLFGLMPLWLPFLWGYGFVTIKRILELLKLVN